MTAPGRGVYTYMYQPGGTLRLESIKEGATVRYGYFYAGEAGNRGNVTTRTAPTTSQAFTFDRAQRIVALAGGATQTYTYDGLGRRATIDELDTGAHSDHVYNQAGQFLYDHRSNDYNLKSGSAWTKYFYLDRHLIATATSIGGPGPGGIATYQHTDGLGSPVITTGDKGVVFGYTLHEPYGRSTEPLHTFQYEPGYAGHVVDPSTGLSYMQQRYYDPAAGRFLSVDPVAASAGSFNRYWYANNNPYKFVDPDGRMSSFADHPSLRGGFTSIQVAQQARAIEDKSMEAVGNAVGEKVSIKAVGTASMGTGINAEKTIAGGSADQVGWVPVGQGAHVALVAEVKVASINLFDGAKESPVSFELSGDIGLGPSIGGKIALDPGGQLNIAINLGVGIGAHADYSPTVNLNVNEQVKPKP